MVTFGIFYLQIADTKRMKRAMSIAEAKMQVERLVGRKVAVRHNKGRNRIKRYSGVVTETHPNVFVIKLNNELFDHISCSYSDVVCGEIMLKEQPR